MVENALTVEEAAKKLRVTTKTLRKYLREKRIPAAQFGRMYRIAERTIDMILLNTLKIDLASCIASDLRKRELSPEQIVDKYRESNVAIENVKKIWDNAVSMHGTVSFKPKKPWDEPIYWK